MSNFDTLIDDIRRQAVHNTAAAIGPVCILWPDADRHWASAIPMMKSRMPELYELGDYAPEEHRGPAIWLRCVVANLVSDMPTDRIPVLYLPGISKNDIRADGEIACRPLVPLQYLAKIWAHENGRDYTPAAFFKARLKWNISSDEATKKALRLSMPQLLDLCAEDLSGREIHADDIYRTVLGNDLDAWMLDWLNDEAAFRLRIEAKWELWCEACKNLYDVDPVAGSVLTGAARLAEHIETHWESVYKRFCLHPEDYPGVVSNLYKTSPKKTIFWTNEEHIGWPQWNDLQEKSLRDGLASLCERSFADITQSLPGLEMAHRDRRNCVWARLGKTPFANAVVLLAELVGGVQKARVSLSSFDAIAAQYAGQDYIIDELVLRILSIPFSGSDRKIIYRLLDIIYLPWLESSAHHLQQLCNEQEYPAKRSLEPRKYESGTCVMFVDGLRLDVAKRLSDALTNAGMSVRESTRWAPIPTVTATGKVAVSPVAHAFIGLEDSSDFSPVSSSHHKASDLYQVLREHHWVRIYEDTEELYEYAWYEFGNIDKEGHEKGARLSEYINSYIDDIKHQIMRITNMGYRQIYIVTDHGWLLYPGGLPKTELLQILTESKWGRCAILKDGANAPVNCYPWYWNPCRQIAIANDICCYRKGMEYAHGGISIQECLTMELCVLANDASVLPAIRIDSIRWRSLRCNIIYDGDAENLVLDIRTQPADASTSIVAKVKQIANGGGFVLVKDEDYIGTTAFVVIVYDNGQIASQSETVVGG